MHGDWVKMARWRLSIIAYEAQLRGVRQMALLGHVSKVHALKTVIKYDELDF